MSWMNPMYLILYMFLFECVQPINASHNAPNIILILADDLGYGDLSLTGSRQIHTPNIDSIAFDGVFCTNAYVVSSVCAPSRAGLMTGRHPASFGFRDNLAPVQKGHDPEFVGLPVEQKTIAERLKMLGYITGIIGKWHLGDLPHFEPCRRGFDEFWGYLGGAHDYFRAEKVSESQLSAPIQCSYKEARPLTYLTDDQGDECVDFIRRHHDQPFFLFASFAAPHSPMQALEEDLLRFANVPENLRRTYCAMVYRLDLNVGKILHEVRRLKIERDTIIIFLSDNGGPCAPPIANGSLNVPYRGSKTTVLEGGIRVPMLLRWPAVLPSNKRISAVVSALVILPTCVKAAGGSLERSSQLDGFDLLPLLTGESQISPHDSLMWNYTVGSAIRKGDWKLIRLPDRLPMLFNLAVDPHEKHDVGSEHIDIARAMLKELGTWETRCPNPLFREPSDWRRRHLGFYDILYPTQQPN